MVVRYSNDPYGNIIKNERPNTPGVDYNYDNDVAKTNLRKRTDADINKMRALAQWDLEEPEVLTKAGTRIAELSDLKNSNKPMSIDQLNELYQLEQSYGPLNVISQKLNDIQAQKALKSKMALATVEARNKAALRPYGETEEGFKYGKEADIRKEAVKGQKPNTAETKYTNKLKMQNFMGKYGISVDPYTKEYMFQTPLTKEQLVGFASEAQAMGLNVYMSPDGKISGIVPINQTDSTISGLGRNYPSENNGVGDGRINIIDRDNTDIDVRSQKTGLRNRMNDPVSQKFQPYLDMGLTGAQAATAITKGQTPLEAKDVFEINGKETKSGELITPKNTPYEKQKYKNENFNKNWTGIKVDKKGSIWGKDTNGRFRRIARKPNERIYNNRYPNPEYDEYLKFLQSNVRGNPSVRNAYADTFTMIGPK
jgi:hypothetical protein